MQPGGGFSAQSNARKSSPITTSGDCRHFRVQGGQDR
jgi:hypothetical protein